MQIIQHQELGSTQASIEFTSIPQTFTDLCVVLSLRTNASANNGSLLYRLNGSTSGYSARILWGNGSSTGSFAPTTETSANATGTWGRLANIGTTDSGDTASTFSSVSFYLPNYTSGNAKSGSLDAVNETNATAADQEIVATLWTGTAAITSVAFATYQGSFVQYSSATLYGVLKGSDGIVSVS
jgi:hypothetical protein